MKYTFLEARRRKRGRSGTKIYRFRIPGYYLSAYNGENDALLAYFSFTLIIMMNSDKI